MKNIIWILLTTTLLVGCASHSGTQAAQSTAAGGEVVSGATPESLILSVSEAEAEKGLFSLDLDNADIREVIGYIADILGKNFIIDNDVRGTVTIAAPAKISRDDLYPLLETILAARGYVAVPAGRVIRVSSQRAGSRENVRVRVGSDPEEIPAEDSLVTQLIPIRHVPVSRIRSALGVLFSKDSSAIAYPGTNTLIVTDLSSRVRRLASIIRQLDVPDGIEEPNRHWAGMDIREVIQTFSDLTGKNFIVGGTVRGKVSLFTPSGIPEGDYLKSLETILDVYGFKMETAGDFIKVVRDPSKSSAQPVQQED